MSRKENFEHLRVIMIGAHPDDCEYYAGATAALWAEKGARVQFLSVANGDAGHQSQGGGALARRRRAEAERSAKILGVDSLVLDFHDGELLPTLEVRWAVIRAIRNWKADIVITHRPNDYHPDHRYTSQAVQDAAFLVVVPNVCSDTPALKKNPVFLYFADQFKKPYPFQPDVIVDATAAIGKKLESLNAMESQMYEWLPWLEGDTDRVPDSRAERLKWLENFFSEHLTSAAREHAGLLAARYGAEHASRVRYAEAFELCEYGRQVTREQLWEMFPR